MSVLEITSEQSLNSLLASGPTVIDFFATWCGPCKAFAPTFARMAATYTTVQFAKVDVDRNPTISQRFQIRAMPTFVFFVDGREVQRVQGANQSAIDTAIAQLVRSRPNPTAAGGAGRKLGGAEEWYVGSGQAVLSRKPPGATATDAGAAHHDVVRDVFERARAMGAEQVQSSGSDGAAAAVFGGAGRRLGHTAGPSPAMAPVVKDGAKVRIAFYSNGFIVDDGPLRRLDDPASEAFLQAIQRGVVPREISSAHPGKEIDVELENRSNEPYAEKFRPFQGPGSRLASSGDPTAPKAAATATATKSEADGKPRANTTAHDESDEIVCDGDVCRRVPRANAAATGAQPVGSAALSSNLTPATTVRVMLQLPNGSRYPVDLPADVTLAALRSEASRASGLARCDLLTRIGAQMSYLSDDSLTIAAAGCDRAIVFVKPQVS